ncbi:Hypothetical predicted protein [Mytilus galloprovincialis]|uniref:Uncharacterized protein n=1 Tax=Mytilus galloprovincialis TaxID=29158 RepID=A0A8B6HMT5_MYTGA|nr:Hypothetical predicted protein [Mytilus galloprovincialis]
MYKQKICKDINDNIEKNPKSFWAMLNKLDKMHDNADSFQDIPHDKIVQFFKKLNKSDDNCSSFHKTIMEHFQQLKDNIDNDPSINILDVDITTDEIIKSIKALKNGKSTAMDLVSNEVLKYGEIKVIYEQVSNSLDKRLSVGVGLNLPSLKRPKPRQGFKRLILSDLMNCHPTPSPPPPPGLGFWYFFLLFNSKN